jgi:hypothetical protein
MRHSLRLFLILSLLLAAPFSSAQTIAVHSYDSQQVASFLAVSIQKRHLPYKLVDDESKADYILYVGNLDFKPRSKASKATEAGMIAGEAITFGVAAAPVAVLILGVPSADPHKHYAQVVLHDNRQQQEVWEMGVKVRNTSQRTADDIVKHLSGYLK